MTRVTITIDKGICYLDCIEHSEDHDVCTIVSSVLNVILMSYPDDYEPEIYEPGHVRIMDNNASEETKAVFKAAKRTLQALAMQEPKYIKVF